MSAYAMKDVLDHGFVHLIDVMGDDQAIVAAARVSYGKGTTRSSSNKELIRYLMRHGHTSPFEMCELKFHIKLPIFVARQWLRHRTASVNEVSGRYSIISTEFHKPWNDDESGLAYQSTSNKQGRSHQLLNEPLAERVLGEFNGAYAQAVRAYQTAIELGVARETAREVLPVSTYTEIVWKIDLHNLLHFLRLRMDSHAQYEIRQYAYAIADVVQELFPLAWGAFYDYRLKAVSLSRIEAHMLWDLVKHTPDCAERAKCMITEAADLSNREKAELAHKLGVELE